MQAVIFIMFLGLLTICGIDDTLRFCTSIGLSTSSMMIAIYDTVKITAYLSKLLQLVDFHMSVSDIFLKLYEYFSLRLDYQKQYKIDSRHYADSYSTFLSHAPEGRRLEYRLWSSVSRMILQDVGFNIASDLQYRV